MADFLVRAIPLFPLLACLFVALVGARWLKDKSHLPVALACGLSCACAVLLLFSLSPSPSNPSGQKTVTLYQWMQVTEPVVADIPPYQPGGAGGSPGLDAQIALRADSLSATMLAMLTFVATLVVIYASGYMHDDRSYWRFFAIVALFVFSMIMLVLSASFLQLFVFWEAVGLCSYLLIGFWYEKPEAAAAGMKAFVVNRIGDFGFAAGVFLIWVTFGSTDFAKVLDASAVAEVAQRNPYLLTTICLCLFTGAIGKSAQFPLHVWLPDAMEGPTPVSALIHAATMVTAGVYLVARCTPLYQLSPTAQAFVSVIGCITALLAALIALTQTDLKRVLAYSTVSQLGFMFLGLGTGSLVGVGGAMFHLVTHAFFKALLFLGAGSVMHAMGGVIDMREFRGLKKLMPQTHTTFLVGALALAGLPPLSGFWSKDTILGAVYEQAHPHHAAVATDDAAGTTASEASSQVTPFGMPRTSLYNLLYWLGTFTAFLTAFYTFRAFFLTFYNGPEKIPHAAGHHAHESPAVMCRPLWVLSVGAALLGLLFGHLTGVFDGFLGRTIPGLAEAAHEHGINWTVALVSTLVALAGVALAWVMYKEESPIPARVAALAGPFTRLSEQRFYLDEVYKLLVVRPLEALSQVSRFADWLLVDGALVTGVSRIPSLLGQLPRPIQNGLVQFYALAMMLATAVLMWALLSKQT
ncbi:MAG TPA: NADH-quinone oxidoreductase subunit L [Planctomycetaceae bacterium]|nr:NADH-quinone oxidoreductase subunit L [Planctomycetaceae bacterium]